MLTDCSGKFLYSIVFNLSQGHQRALFYFAIFSVCLYQVATLTVRANTAGSHQNRGWEEFTDAAIKALSDKREHVVFILWGNYAKQKGAHINRAKHLTIESRHPSPFAANNGFFGSKPFSKTNEYLKAHGKTPIDWL